MPAVRIGTSLRVFWRLHRGFMRLTRGRFSRVGAMDALLLTTKGRKSGERRDVALNYMRDGDAYVLVASYAGEDRDPAWWRNLEADPEAEVTVAGKRLKVRTRESDGAERERLWARSSRRTPRTTTSSGRSGASRSSCSSGPRTAAARVATPAPPGDHRHLRRRGNVSVRRPARRSEVRAKARTLAIWLAQNWPSGRRGRRAGYHNRVGVDQLGEAWRSRVLETTGGGFGMQATSLCRDGGDSPGGPARVL